METIKVQPIILGKKQFEAPIWEAVNNRPKYIRRGQQVFNTVEELYGVAREVQFVDGVDCFYLDKNIEPFLEKAYNRYLERAQEDWTYAEQFETFAERYVGDEK